MRVIFAVGVVLYGGAFIILDRIALPHEAFVTLAITRVVITIHFLLLIAFTYTKAFRKVWQPLVAFSIAMAASGAGSACFYIAPTDPYVHLISPTYVLFMMLTFTALRLSLGWALVSGIIQIASFNACSFLSGASDGLALVGHNAVLVSTFLMGAVLNWEMWRYEKRDFVLLRQIGRERERSEQLLLNVLPAPVAERLKAGEDNIADAYPEATVLFADICNFTELKIEADELVRFLNRIFTAFDVLADKHGLEKIKTIGDAYMVVASVPTPRKDHAEATARLALEMLDTVHAMRSSIGFPIEIRIGMHTGPLVGGVIGKRKFSFDIWGDTVNTASRMESHGLPGQIQISEPLYQKIKHNFDCTDRGVIHVKGKGSMHTYLLTNVKQLSTKSFENAERTEAI